MVPQMSSAPEPQLRSSKRSGSSSASQGADALSDKPILRSAADQAIIDRVMAKQQASKSMARWKIEEDGDDYWISPVMEDHDLAIAMSLDALGLTTGEELRSVLGTLAKQARKDGIISTKKFTSMLAYVCSIQPRDPIEAMLAVHMAIINEAIGEMSKALDDAKNIMQVDSANNALNKLTRTFTEQMSALKKHRSGGPQRIIVERMEVKAGGQAIVGAFGKDRDGAGGVTINEGVEMTAPQDRRPRAPKLTSARHEEELEVPFPDHLGPAFDQKVAVERKVQVPPAPQETASPATPEPPRAPRAGRVNLGHAAMKRKRW